MLNESVIPKTIPISSQLNEWKTPNKLKLASIKEYISKRKKSERPEENKKFETINNIAKPAYQNEQLNEKVIESGRSVALPDINTSTLSNKAMTNLYHLGIRTRK